MQVNANGEVFAQSLERTFDHFANLRGHADTDCVGKGDFFRTCLGHCFGNIKWARRRHRSFERTTKTGGNRDLHFQSRRFGERDHRAVRRDAFGNGLSLIGDAEAVRGDDHAPGFVDPARPGPRRNRALHPADVHAKPCVADVRVIGQACDDGFGVGHLRDAFGVGKARDLDPSCADFDKAFDQRNLVGGRYRFGFVLQPVTWTDFNDVNGRVHRFCIQIAI